MEQVYWLSRQRVSLKAAQDLVSAEARLIYYDLAGRYSVKARSAETHAIDLEARCRALVLPTATKEACNA